MASQVLIKSWKDRTKENVLDVVEQYADYLNASFERPNFRAYDNQEMYVPTPEMVKQFTYRVRSPRVRARIKVAIETGASAGEVWRLTWKEFNPSNKKLTIIGVKGHRTLTYSVSDELVTLLLEISRTEERIFSEIKDSGLLNDSISDYKRRIAQETGNADFLKIHFHSFRHFAISWHYFKTKDIVETQRFGRHCNIANTLYVHIVKSWIKSNEYDVVYATDKIELTKYLSEGFSLITKADWGFCLTKPKSL